MHNIVLNPHETILLLVLHLVTLVFAHMLSVTYDIRVVMTHVCLHSMCYCHGREVEVSKSVNNPDYRLKFSKMQCI